MKTKAQMMWESYRNAEKEFLKEFNEKFEELMKAIRGTEYRRGKEDGRKEMETELKGDKHETS